MKNCKFSFLRGVRASLLLIVVIGFQNIPAANLPEGATITKIRAYPDYAVVYYSPEYENGLGCGGSIANSAALISWENDAERKVMYASLLAAYVSGQPIGLGIGSCTGWGGGIPAIYRVDLPEQGQ